MISLMQSPLINETKRNSNKDNKKFYTFQEKEIKICIKQ